MEILTFGLGLIFGGIITFLIMKKRNKAIINNNGIDGGRDDINKQQ